MKEIKFIYLMVIFIITLFISACGKQQTVEEKLLNHLSEKYNEQFEVIEKLDERQYTSSGITIDGAVFKKSKEVKGKYEYYYSIKSLDTGIESQIYVIDNKGKCTFTDSYDICKEFRTIAEDLQDFVIKTVGNENSTKDSYYGDNYYDMYYPCTVNVYLDENFKGIEDLKNKLNTILEYKSESDTYVTELNNNSDSEMWFSIYIFDNDDNCIDVSRYYSLNGFYVFDKYGNPGIEISEYLGNN